MSLQAKGGRGKQAWKDLIIAASLEEIPNPHFASAGRISVTLFYFPSEPMQGDIDNIVKPILDALCGHIYIDDRQVERVLVQKFERGRVITFSPPSSKFIEALNEDEPILYIRVTDDPLEELG